MDSAGAEVVALDDLGVSDSGSLEALVERLLVRVRELESVVVQQRRVIAEQADRIVELERLVDLPELPGTAGLPPSTLLLEPEVG
jgi:hypothetical protein